MAEKLEIVIAGKDEFSNAFGKLRSALPSLKTLAIGAAAGVAAVGTGLFAIASSTAKAGDELQKMSLRVGISTETLSGFSYAAELSGASIDDVERSLRAMSRKMNEANDGLAEAKRAFDTLGIKVADTSGNLRKGDDVLYEAADALSKMSDKTKAAALAQEIFGKSGSALLPLMKEGSAGIRKMQEEAGRLGVAFSTDAANNAAEFVDAMTRLKSSFIGIRNAIGNMLIPYIAGLSNKFADFVADNRARIVSFAESFLTAMGQIAEKGAYAVAILIDSWRGLGMIAQKTIAVYAQFGILLEKYITPILDKLFGHTRAAAEETISRLEEMAEVAGVKLNELIDEGLAIAKVTEYAEKIKAAIQEIKDAGLGVMPTERAPEGIPPFTEGNVKVAEDAIKKLQAMYNEYFLTEAQRLDVWYEEELAKIEGHQEAIAMLQDLYAERKAQLIEKQIEDEKNKYQALIDLHDEFFLTETKKLEKWYKTEKEKFEGNEKALVKLTELYEGKKKAIEDKNRTDKEKADLERWNKSVQQMQTYSQTMMEIAIEYGGKSSALAKAFALYNATISTYQAAAQALRDVPFPYNIVAAAIVTAHGMMQVHQIMSAHTGLEYVPKEQPYLLAQGERVLAPGENKELMEMMRRNTGGEGTVHIEHFNPVVEVLPNATNPDAMLRMSKDDWKEIIERKIFPAMRDLRYAGVMA